MTAISAKLAKELNHSEAGITQAIKLLDDGSSLHFIARYRKDLTRDLDDEKLFALQNRLKQLRKLDITKSKSLEKLQELGKLNDHYSKLINECITISDIDIIMQPFKSKRKTKASLARELGFQKLSNCILGRESSRIEDCMVDGQGNTDEQITKALDIVSEELINQPVMRKIAVDQIMKEQIKVKLIDTDNSNIEKLDGIRVESLKSHQIHSLFRMENNKEIGISFNINRDRLNKQLLKEVKSPRKYRNHVERALEDGSKRLLIPRATTSVRNLLKLKADEMAISVFKINLEKLLLQSPIEPQVVLGIDPGYRSGCKVAVINDTGDLLDHGTIDPTPPREDIKGSEKIIRGLISKYKVTFITIGNGTASKETKKFIDSLKLKDIEIILVSEDGASVYSASKIAREEFPDINVEIRGAISIARRVLDPLAEFVKIRPQSLGVGQYQHEVDQKLLEESLDFVVSKAINNVGINLDTASKEALEHISGITPALAKNIVEYREKNGFNNLKALKKVKRLGNATFEMAAGFLRLPSSDNLLDSTLIHPDHYKIAEDIIKSLKHTDDSWKELPKVERKKLLRNISNKYEIDDILFTDVISELILFGEDPRGTRKIVKITKKFEAIEEIKLNDIVTGEVLNVTNFGAFVDLGIKENGLIHISNLSDQFVSNIHEYISRGDVVSVMIISLDIDKKRIGLKLLSKQ